MMVKGIIRIVVEAVVNRLRSLLAVELSVKVGRMVKLPNRNECLVPVYRCVILSLLLLLLATIVYQYPSTLFKRFQPV